MNFIVSGHGSIASGLKSSLNLIAGDFGNISFIDFINDAEKLKVDMEKVITENLNSNFLVLTDLFGGTPFKTAALLSKGHKNIAVVSGVNLPMLISVVYDNKSSLEELAALAIKSGKDGIKQFI